jgi:DHA2 family multidrug resistance protein
MRPEQSNQVSAMINRMRNMGGSIGISAVTTLIERRTQVHQAYLVHNISSASTRLQRVLAEMTAHFATRTGEVEATRQAYARIYEELGRQATMLAYIDTFHVMGVVCLVAIGLLLVARKTNPGSAPVAH